MIKKIYAVCIGIVLMVLASISWYILPESRLIANKDTISSGDIISIEIRKSGGIAGVSEYCLIDFVNNQSVIKHDRVDDMQQIRFSEDDEKDFISAANSCRLFKYQRKPDNSITDAFYYNIDITFSDYSMHNMAEFPDDDDLYEALREKLGCDIV